MLTLTVITPSFNQGPFIKKTIDSVLSQNNENLEYIIMDGNSTDNTLDVLKSYKKNITWFSEPDKGQTDAVNKGIKLAKGDIIGWLNSDDIYYPQAIKKVLEVFEHNPDIQVVYGMADHIDTNDQYIENYPTEPWNYEKLKEICYICQPALFFRKTLVEELGLLNEKLNYCMDYEYWLRLGSKYPFYYLTEKLAGSRLYSENKTLGDRIPVHIEICVMLKEKFGKTPLRWLLGTAWVIAEEKKYNVKKLFGRICYFNKIILSNFKLFYKFNRQFFPVNYIIQTLKVLKNVNSYHQLLSPQHCDN